jgi:hypothetical protein
MKQHACFTFSSIVEFAAEKVLQFIMPLKSIDNKNFSFVKQKCIFEHYGKVKTRKDV